MHSGPRQPHRQHRVEIKPPCPPRPLHHAQRRLRRIKTKPEKRIGRPETEGFQPRKGISHQPSPHPLRWRVWPENRNPANQSLGMFFSQLEKGPNLLRRMLPVRIHRQQMREPLARRLPQCRQHRAALARVFFHPQKPHAFQTQILGLAVAPIRASIHHHPNIGTLRPRRPQGSRELGTAVERGQNDDRTKTHGACSQ